jgi:hypothetical protein
MEKIIWIASISAIIIILGLAFIQPYFEVKTFNACTGSHAGYWDAAFAELRVFDCKN